MTAKRKFSRTYTDEDLLKAIVDIRVNKITQREAAEKYKVPKTTLNDRLSGRYAPSTLKPGTRTKLTKEQEKRLCDFIKYRSKIGSDLTREEIGRTVKCILDKAEEMLMKPISDEERLFSNNLPSKSWIHRFVSRQEGLSLRTPEHLGHLKKRVTEAQLRNWYKQLESFLLEEHDIVASEFLVPENSHRIFNLDEVGFPLSATNKLRVVAEKGAKNDSSVSTESKKQITVLGCVSASGEFRKPFVIFPGARPNFNMEQVGPDKYDLGATPDGWIDSDSFFSWFTNLFIGKIKKDVEFPIIVFLDGHSAYTNIAVSEFCRNNKVILYCLPAHASHIIQPLDISVYGPLEKLWHKAISDHQREHNQTVSRTNFFTKFDIAWEKAKGNRQNVISGFKKAGLVPFNANALDYSKITDEEIAAKEFNSSSTNANADVKLGIAIALKAFESKIGSAQKADFEKRVKRGCDLEDDTLYNCYKAIKLAFVGDQEM